MKKEKVRINKSFLKIFFLVLILLYAVVRIIFPNVFFSNSYKSGDLTFYYNDLSNYGINSENQTENFYFMCDKVAESLITNPFYSQKKIKILFCDSYGLFTFFNPTASKALGTTVSIFNYAVIILTKSDFTDLTLLSSERENSKRSIMTVLQHELTHAYMAKISSLVNMITTPTWKEEGICEVVASDSTYNIDEGIERLISKSPDNSNSYKYFTYRMCVLYLMKHDGLSFKEVIKDKRKKKEILSELYSLPEAELKKLLE